MSVSPNGLIYQTINPDAQGAPLVVVHETAKMRQLLRDSAPDNQRVIILFSQGTDGQTRLCGSVEATAHYYLAALDGIGIVEPYYLAGFSAGAMIAFEMAQQLSANGKTPLQLTLIGAPCGTIKSASLLGAHNKRVGKAMAAETYRSRQDSVAITRCVYAAKYCRRWLSLFVHIHRMYWRMRYLVWRNKKLPPHLVWYYLTGVYIDLAWRYVKRDYFGSVVMVYEKNTANHIWLSHFKGRVDLVADVDCDHYELVETEHAKVWLDRIFARP